MLKSYFDRLLGQELPREATINFGAIGIMQQDFVYIFEAISNGMLSLLI
jgi:hypothetical protein